MSRSLSEVMKAKSDEGLTDYINNFNKYTPEAILAAVNELRKRGKKFSDQELEDIDRKMHARAKAEYEEQNYLVADALTNIVEDPNAPLLYSKAAILAFSSVFTVLFGAFLLADNVNGKKKKLIIIGFGIAYFIISIIIINVPSVSKYWLTLLNGSGGLGLITTFWDKYIGKDVKYRAKPIGFPLTISIIISILLLLAIIYSR
ncbi:hypothetical protein ACFQ21_02595 [Ohtaekwangia kribbensis]|uniref:Uncharacterized protein n=1 Tax=Ohtaekwangia kribbensis TaxID=688913 RepID=A0ABW3JYD4_9BACT